MSIRCFRFLPDGTVETRDALPARLPDDGANPSVWWFDLWAPTPEQVQSLSDLMSLESHTIEELSEDDGRANIDYFEDYAGLLLYGMLGAEESDQPRPRMINLICTAQAVATVHAQSIGSIEYLVGRVTRIAPQVSKKGVGHLLFLHLDKMVDNSMMLAKRYEQELEVLEDRSVDIDCEDDLLEDLADVRRRVLDLWQVQVAQREVLIELCDNELDHLSDEGRRRLEHVRDHMTSSLEIVEILRGMVGEVRENYRTTISLRSADAMNKLTVFAGLMLPVSVIAGIYGMNVPLWPDPSRPGTFWVVIGSMAGVMAALTVYFRRRNWL
ncbi:Magnesium transport protein CorA [Posidoniimonas polymericola]|uniref:Magnesium transport protein CorA n=1 Tax=Posidoniimonas polymericola TaxID=2528002 RepID=A0A5C5ZF99_9BACT|nr:magnesium transporter CorA family protein [Posidoniimonas polymericola]TWT85866.1 Magnesium transport protein CorA [Posidoniimonas polymericola]